MTYFVMIYKIKCFSKMVAFTLKNHVLRHFIYELISSKISSIDSGGIHSVKCCRKIVSEVRTTNFDKVNVEIDWRTMKCMQRNC